MSPISHKKTGTSGFTYQSVFVGPTHWTIALTCTLSGLSDDEIDAYGYLKPGVPFDKDGAPVGVGAAVFGVTVEEVKVADDNAPATIAALTTQQITLAVIGVVNRKVAEDILGRVYTVNEAAGFDLAGSKIVLTPFSA